MSEAVGAQGVQLSKFVGDDEAPHLHIQNRRMNGVGWNAAASAACLWEPAVADQPECLTIPALHPQPNGAVPAVAQKLVDVRSRETGSTSLADGVDIIGAKTPNQHSLILGADAAAECFAMPLRRFGVGAPPNADQVVRHAQPRRGVFGSK